MISVGPSAPLSATDPQQWEAGAVGQTAGTFEGTRPQSSHLFPDGTDAGYSGRISEKPAVPFSGSYAFTHEHQFSKHTSIPRILFQLARNDEKK